MISVQIARRWRAPRVAGRGAAQVGRLGGEGYGTFRLNFHHFDRFELDLRGNTHVRGAAFSCPHLKSADMVLI